MLGALGWRFVADPSLAAPTRDPAWYTWRANVVMQDDPGSIVRDWGPNGLFSGGYRVTVPLEGALLQRVVGIDTYSFAKFLMLGVPILTGLALGAGAVRSRKDPVAFLTMLLATVALFLTTPYVGYLDNITVLFLLALMLPFLQAARTSWGARTALFLIGIAAAFTHPTTCVLFGVTLLAVFGFHLVTSRFRLGRSAPLRRADAVVGRPRHGRWACVLGRRHLGTDARASRMRPSRRRTRRRSSSTGCWNGSARCSR